MNTFHYDAFGNLLPGPSVSALEGASGGASKILATGAAILHSGGVYDGAAAAFYAGAIRPKDMSGLFTSQDTHEGECTDPARLQRYAYANESRMDTADPA